MGGGRAERSPRQAQEEVLRPAVDLARQVDTVVHALIEFVTTPLRLGGAPPERSCRSPVI